MRKVMISKSCLPLVVIVCALKTPTCKTTSKSSWVVTAEPHSMDKGERQWTASFPLILGYPEPLVPVQQRIEAVPLVL